MQILVYQGVPCELIPEPRPVLGKRSPRWPAVRKAHLETCGWCMACGATEHLEVHHVRPFHLFPGLELDPANLITLCESPSHNCHLIWGHLLSWRSWNECVWKDAADWRARFQGRP